MDIKLKSALGLGALQDYAEELRPALRELVPDVAQRLVDLYSDIAPRDTGAMAESFYIVTRDYNGYSEALKEFTSRNPHGYPTQPLTRPSSNFFTKVGAVADYLFYVERTQPFLQDGLVRAAAYTNKRLDKIIKGLS